MAWKEENIDTYVRDMVTRKLRSTFAHTKPLTAMLAGSSLAGLEALGAPDSGVFWGGMDLGIGTKNKIRGSKTHSFRMQTDQSDPDEQIDAGGPTPTASVFAEDLTGTAGVNWHVSSAPLKVRVDSVQNATEASLPETTKNNNIAEIMEEAVDFGLQRKLEALQAKLWTGTLTSAQQAFSIQNWVTVLGMQHIVSDGTSSGETGFTIYGGVDRTVETELKGNVTLASSLGSTVPTLRLLRQLRLLTTHGAIRRKRANAGSLIITTPDLFEVLSSEADDNNQINSNDIRAFAVTGFINPLIRLDDALIAWDHDCPSGEMYVTTPEDYVFEVHSAENFQVGPWVRKDQTEEGGDRYIWNNLVGKLRLTCRRPDLNVKVTGLTTT